MVLDKKLHNPLGTIPMKGDVLKTDEYQRQLNIRTLIERESEKNDWNEGQELIGRYKLSQKSNQKIKDILYNRIF